MTPTELAALNARIRKAEDLLQSGQYAAARDRYEQMLRERLAACGVEAPLSQSLQRVDMAIIDRLGELAVLFSQPQAADALFASMAALCEDAGNRYAADYAVLKRIETALESGALGQAQKLLEAMQPSIGNIHGLKFSVRGLTEWEAQCAWPPAGREDWSVLFSRLYLVLGRILASLGQYRAAIAALKRGLMHTGPDSPELARRAIVPLTMALAAARLEKGEIRKAGATAIRLEPLMDEVRHPGFFVQWLSLLGKTHLLQGEMGPALQCFQRSYDVCARRGFVQAALGAQLNLAHVQIILNQTSPARESLAWVKAQALLLDDLATAAQADFLLQLARQRSHSMADGLPLARSVYENWRSEIAALADDGQPPPASPLDLPQADNYLAFFEDRQLGFYWLLGTLNWEACTRWLSQLREIFRATDSTLIKLRLRVLAGILDYYAENYEQAEATFAEAQSQLRKLKLLPEQWQVQRFRGWCWARLRRSESEQVRLAEETRQLLAAMVKSLGAVEGAIFMLNKWTQEEEEIARAFNHLAKLKEQLPSLPWWRRWRRRWAMLQQLNALMQHVERYRNAAFERHLSGQEIRIEKHPPSPWWWRLLRQSPRRATLSFLVLPDRTLVMRTGWLSLDFAISSVTRNQVRAMIARWHELVREFRSARDLGAVGNQTAPSEPSADALPARPPANPTDLLLERDALSRRLAELLQFPALLRDLPARVSGLTIMPDDSLHGFPFAAILLDDRRYLIERYSLSLAFFSFAPGPAEVVTVGNASPEAITVGVSQGASVGIPPITEFIEPLPGVSRELDFVSQWLSPKIRVRRLDDSSPQYTRARKADLLKLLPAASFFHIACHGISQPDAPDQSGMVLLPAPDQPEVLSLREISELELSGLRHATLSSCWSANHFILPGRWIIGLAETLCRAGARSVLGCLWVADDELAVAFLKRFYEYCESSPRDEALRRAQLDCLRGQLDCEVGDQPNPYFWGGYNLYGDYSRLKL